MRKFRKQAQKKFATSKADLWFLQKLVADAFLAAE